MTIYDLILTIVPACAGMTILLSLSLWPGKERLKPQINADVRRYSFDGITGFTEIVFLPRSARRNTKFLLDVKM